MTVSVTRPGSGDAPVPSVVLRPDDVRGRAIVVHGYGGSKEEVLGLAWRIAERGFTTTAIDLRGHGENPAVYDARILDDVVSVVRRAQNDGPVVAVGHSLGGRLCLLSSADFKVGISPAPREVSPATRQLITQLRGHAVRESHAGVNFETLTALPEWEVRDVDRTLILYASGDIPEIKARCGALESGPARVERIENAGHGDMVCSPAVFASIGRQLDRWFPR